MGWIVLGAIGAFVITACGGGSTGASNSSALPDGNGSGAASSDRPASAGGERAPDLELVVFGNEDYTRGDLIRLSDFFGQPVVINFWFPSCPPCRAEMPDLEEAFKVHKKDGVVFIGVQLLGLDTAKDGQAFIDELGITYAVGADDGAIIREYEVISFPTTIFLDGNHEIVRKWAGILTPDKLEELIQESLRATEREMATGLPD